MKDQQTQGEGNTQAEKSTPQEWLEGRHVIAEALAAGRPIDRLFVLKTAEGLSALLRDAKNAGVVVIECDRRRLDRMSTTGRHQGVMASVAAFAYAEPEALEAHAAAAGEPLFVVVLDGVQNEGNLGAMIRSAEVVGAHGVVIPKRRSAGLTPVTVSASAGAVAHIPVARVPGVPGYLRTLRDKGVWIYGATGDGAQSVFETDFSGPAALVLGSEEEGLSRLTRELCDVLVRLPMRGKTGSLNVSAAAAVILYEMARRKQLLQT